MSGEIDVEALKKKLTRRQLINWYVYFQHKDDGLLEPGRIEWYLMQIRKQLVYVCAGLGVDKIPDITEKEQLKLTRMSKEEADEIKAEEIRAKHEMFFSSLQRIGKK